MKKKCSDIRVNLGHQIIKFTKFTKKERDFFVLNRLIKRR